MTAVLLGRIIVPDFFNPRPEDVDKGFMFWRMRQIRRFSGNRAALTLDLHHEFCGLIADDMGAPPAVRLWARLHDLHEFATGDIVRPVRAALGDDLLADVQRRWDAAIAARLGIALPTESEALEVRLIDDMAMGAEWQIVLGRDLDDIGCVVPPAPENAADLIAAAHKALGQPDHGAEGMAQLNERAYAASAFAAEKRLQRGGLAV